MDRDDLAGTARSTLNTTTPWLARLQAAGQAFLDLLYPPRCAGCGRLGALFCETCRARLIPTPSHVCRRCGKPEAAGGLCAACRRTPSPLDGILSSAVFAPPLRTVIHHFKYRNGHALAAPLAALLITTWQQASLSADLIVPVPLHASRISERGYNQSTLLARALSSAVGVTVVDDLLERERATLPQTHLNRQERSQNVSGAFVCRTHLSGTSLVLVDDVCTTGATLEACATALRAAGAVHVQGLTVARARWGGDTDGPGPSQP
jgi:ComF family protein